MASEISKDSLEKKIILTILYGREYRIRLSSDLSIYSISDQPQRATEAIHSLIKLSIIKNDFFLDLSDLQDLSSSSLALGESDGITYDIPVRIDSMESLQFQMSVFSENYESLLNKIFPLSLKYLCREKILNIICIRNEPLFNHIDGYSMDCFINKLLQNQCYWKQLPLPVSLKLYLNGCFPICTYAKLLISRVINPVMESPYNLRVLPPVKIVRIRGGQGGYVALNKDNPESAKIEDFIIFPSNDTAVSSIFWIMITIAPNHFIFESIYHPNRYIFAPDPTGKTYNRKSTLFLSRPFYAGPENVFSLVEGGTPYSWIHETGPTCGIKSVKWSKDSSGMFWRWQTDHYHQASKLGDRFGGDECYCIKPVKIN